MKQSVGTLGNEPLIIHITESMEEAKEGYNKIAPKDGEAMLFAFDQAILLPISVGGKGTPLDVVWLEDAHVVGIASHYGGILATTADAALEVPLGWCHKHGIKLGDTLQVSYGSQ